MNWGLAYQYLGWLDNGALPGCTGFNQDLCCFKPRFTLAVTTSGEIWSWGKGFEGQLGLGHCSYLAETMPFRKDFDGDMGLEIVGRFG